MYIELWQRYEIALAIITDKTLYSPIKPSVREVYNLQYRKYRIMNHSTTDDISVRYRPLVYTSDTKLNMAQFYGFKSFIHRKTKDIYETTLSDRYREYKATLKFIQLELPLIYHNKERY